jgi:hypothetical protein
MPTLQPYWGNPAVRNDREDHGNGGIIRSPISRHGPTRLTPVDSMGQRNTNSKSRCSSFKGLISFANVNSKKQLPCLGLNRSGP